MSSILWQELIIGGCIRRPLEKALHGGNVHSLVYWTLKLLRIGTIVSLLLLCEESGHSSMSGQMRRCISHHGGIVSRVVDALTHDGCLMVHSGIVMSIGIKWCMHLCHEVQCYA